MENYKGEKTWARHGNFMLRLMRTDDQWCWEAVAILPTKDEIEAFSGYSAHGHRVVDIPRGYYELPAVVEGMPIVNFECCFEKFENDDGPTILIRSIDLRDVDFSNALFLTNMFARDAFKRTESIKINWKSTGKVTDIDYMFSDCESLTEIDFHGADLRSVINAEGMFMRCSSLRSVDLRTCRLDSLQNAGSMFSRCRQLKELKLPKIPDYGNDLHSFCNECSSLEELDLSPIHSQQISSMRYMIHLCVNLRNLRLPTCKEWELTGTVEPLLLLGKHKYNLEKLTLGNEGFFVEAGGKVQDDLFDGFCNLREADLRFLGDINLNDIDLSGLRGCIIHCSQGTKVPDRVAVVGEDKHIDIEEMEKIGIRLKALDGPGVVVVKHRVNIVHK